MNKDAATTFPVAEFISKRWSPRAFADQAISSAQVGTLLEAARWSASCFNEQPWRFIVGNGRETETYKKLLSCLVPFNQSWASSAPLLMLNVASAKFAKNGKDNIHGRYDLGLSVGGLSAQATSMGIFVHQMAGFDADKAREVFQIPEDHEPLVAMALGYPGNPDDLDEGLKDKEHAPRERKALGEIAFSGSWGKAWQA